MAISRSIAHSPSPRLRVILPAPSVAPRRVPVLAPPARAVAAARLPAAGYRPCQTAGRFSAKARGPSRASSVCAMRSRGARPAPRAIYGSRSHRVGAPRPLAGAALAGRRCAGAPRKPALFAPGGSMADLSALCADLAAEHAALDALLAPLTEPQWALPTPAEGWSVRDTIAHLANGDESGRRDGRRSGGLRGRAADLARRARARLPGAGAGHAGVRGAGLVARRAGRRWSRPIGPWIPPPGSPGTAPA